jgi:hypothetical protein
MLFSRPWMGKNVAENVVINPQHSGADSPFYNPIALLISLLECGLILW